MLNDFIAYYTHCSDYTITHPVIDVICNDVTRSLYHLYHLYHCFGGDTDDTMIRDTTLLSAMERSDQSPLPEAGD